MTIQQQIEMIEDALSYFEDAKVGISITPVFNLVSDDVLTDGHNRLYDLLKRVNDNSYQQIARFIDVNLSKSTQKGLDLRNIQDYSSFIWYYDNLKQAIKRMPGDPDKIKIKDDGHCYKISLQVSDTFEFKNLRRMVESCKLFNTKNPFFLNGKLLVTPEWNPKTGISIYIRENHRGERFELFNNSLTTPHKTDTRWVGINHLFNVKKLYEKPGDVAKDNSYFDDFYKSGSAKGIEFTQIRNSIVAEVEPKDFSIFV